MLNIKVYTCTSNIAQHSLHVGQWISEGSKRHVYLLVLLDLEWGNKVKYLVIIAGAGAGLHDDTGGGAAEGETDGDHGGPTLLPALLLAPGAPLSRVARAEILALGAELRLPRLHILLVLCEQIS